MKTPNSILTYKRQDQAIWPVQYDQSVRRTFRKRAKHFGSQRWMMTMISPASLITAIINGKLVLFGKKRVKNSVLVTWISPPIIPGYYISGNNCISFEKWKGEWNNKLVTLRILVLEFHHNPAVLRLCDYKLLTKA